MVIPTIHFHSDYSRIPLRIAKGHFATNHSHINYYIDMTYTKHRLAEARQAAPERDMRIYERNAPFLDNAVNREEMLAEIIKSLDVANKAGYAIIIGHVDKSADILPKLLEEMYPHLVKQGYRFATPSSL